MLPCCFVIAVPGLCQSPWLAAHPPCILCCLPFEAADCKFQPAGGDSTEALRSAVSGLSLAPPSPASSTSSGAAALGGMAMRPRPQPPPSRLAPSLASAASAAVCFITAIAAMLLLF